MDPRLPEVLTCGLISPNEARRIHAMDPEARELVLTVLARHMSAMEDAGRELREQMMLP